MFECAKINIQDYRKLKEIGTGSFGIVYLIENKKTNITYAAKEDLINGQDDSKSPLINELKSYTKINNYAVLSLIGYSPINFEGFRNQIIITNYMPKGSLDQILKDSRKSLAPNQYTSTAKYIILLGIALGMKYLHSKGIIHRDLKPGNILLDDSLYPHICDFGCSKVSDKKLQQILMKSQKGTPLYMAPEIFSGDHYNYKVDIYAYSIIFYEVISDNPPYSKIKNEFQFINDILNGKRPDLTLVANKTICDFLTSCWSADPYARPTFSQIADFLLQEKIRNFFNTDDEEVNCYIDNFEEELKCVSSYTALDVKLAADKGEIDAIKLYGEMLIKGIGTEIDVEEGIRYLKIASDLGSATSMCNVGYLLSIHSEIENNIEESIEYYKKAIENGNSNAAFNLSVMYHEGIKIEADLVKAAYYMKLAADDGLERAQFDYGYMLMHGEGIPVNIKESAKYFKMSAENGNPESMNILAFMYLNGNGVEVDKEEAGRLYKESADKGNMIAMFEYGQMKKFGDEIKQDKKEAAKYLKMSADLGCIDGAIQYADMLYNGDGIETNLDEAVKYLKKPIEEERSNAIFLYALILYKKNGFSEEFIEYIKKAADLGNNDAALTYSNIFNNKNIDETQLFYSLGIKYYEGNSCPVNKELAAKYFKIAADKGHDDAMYIYARLLRHGEGIPLDINESIKYYKLASNKGNNLAMVNLGHIFERGENVPVNMKEAVHFYKMAADYGNANAKYTYGKCLYLGDGIQQDTEKALFYIKKAAEEGCKLASIFLKFLNNQDDSIEKKEIEFNLDYAKYLYEENNYDDRLKAAKIFKDLADDGVEEGMILYAKMALNGEGITQNIEDALKYYEKAVNFGNIVAMKSLGGLMLQKNKKEDSFRYLRMAANHGDLVSSFLIKNLLV